MATASQLREIRRKAGIGEFSKKKSSAKASRKRPYKRRVSRQPTEQELRESRWNTASKAAFEPTG